MSGPAAAGTAWQREGLVAEFLRDRRRLLPLLDVQEALIEQAYRRHGRAIERFLDVGAGDGAMSELLLRVHPEARAVLVDNSEPMLQRAEARLGPSEQGRWEAARGDLRDTSWCAALPGGRFDAAISSFAIHHLPAARKRALYAELFGLLAPGAMFVNLDFVLIGGPLAGLFDEQMVANAVALEHEHGGARGAEQVEREILADDSDDRPDSAERQIEWLREAGFNDVELHFKWAEAAIFGAVKPS
ncbi:MAG: class I SAM-dependent methyltransferase [Solirubrobacteraceae bacterium]